VADAVTTIAPGAGVTVIVAAADFVKSATDVAVRVTSAGNGTLAGAVYVMGASDLLKVAESRPQERPPQPGPLSLQTTPLLSALFATVAATVSSWPNSTDEAFEETVTERAGDVTIIVAAADFVKSATDVAVRVTSVHDGRAAGAV
jgi:hypothetical protein